MAAQFRFELVSPERRLVDRDVDMVIVPGAEGDFGVLAGHIPFLSPLRPGVIETREGDKVEKLFVAGGFCDVSGDIVTVLAEGASPVSELERATVEADLKAAKIAALNPPEDPVAAAKVADAVLIERAKWTALTGELVEGF